MQHENEIIELVSTFMNLCATITTKGAGDTETFIFEYQDLRRKLLNIEGLQLPMWINASPIPASVLTHVKMEQGSGNGSWQRRREYFHQEKNKLLNSLVPAAANSTPVQQLNATAVLNPWMLTEAERQMPWLIQQQGMSPAVPSPEEVQPAHFQTLPPSPDRTKKVFIVHGHDAELKYQVARFIDELPGFKSVIFHEQRNMGRTIIKKLQDLVGDKDVIYAVVLYTACDSGKAKAETENKPRARQNVVFEHGYLLAHLGQDKIMAITDPEVELPSDLQGVLHYSSRDNWKYELSEELKGLSAG